MTNDRPGMRVGVCAERRGKDARVSAIKAALTLTFIFVSLSPQSAHAGASLQGQLVLPSDFKLPAPVGAPVFWELPNPLLPIAPPVLDPRRRMLVVLEGPAQAAPTKRPSVVRLVDAHFDPPVVAVNPGSKVTLENNDAVMHLVESPAGSAAPIKGRSLAPGDAFSHVFPDEGTYQLRCSEVPHMRATILVTRQPLVALTKNDGSFAFSDIPADKYLLRVWYEGRWIHRMSVQVRGRTAIEVQIPPASAGEN